MQLQPVNLNNRTTADVVKEKYEERGWDLDNESNLETRSKEQINALPFTEEEYSNFSLLLAKLALKDSDSSLCDMYFELQRRAYYGNGYLPIEELSSMEQEMWSMGTGEIVSTAKQKL